MDIQNIIRLVRKTKEIIKNREMAAQVKEKGIAGNGSRLLLDLRFC